MHLKNHSGSGGGGEEGARGVQGSHLITGAVFAGDETLEDHVDISGCSLLFQAFSRDYRRVHPILGNII